MICMCDYFHQFLTAILCFRSQDAFEHEHNAKPCSIFPLQAHTGLWWSRHRKNTYFAMFYFLSESYWQPQLPNTVTSLTSAISLRKVTSGCIYISLSLTLCYQWTVKYIVDGNIKKFLNYLPFQICPSYMP